MACQNVKLAALGLIAAVGLGGCTDGYGYSGVSVGYGNGGYGGGYGGYGEGYYPTDYYGNGYYGWFGDYYYPGTGLYVYDRNHGRHRWNTTQQRYWEGRRGPVQDRSRIRDNWQAFTRDRRQDNQPDRQAYGDRTVTRDQPRTDRNDRTDSRQDYRGDRRAPRQNNRRSRGN